MSKTGGSNWQSGPGSEAQGRAAARRGRRKGAEVVKRTIDAAIAGGPNALLQALNLSATPPPARPEAMSPAEQAEVEWKETRKVIKRIREHTGIEQVKPMVAPTTATEHKEPDDYAPTAFVPVFLALNAIRSIADRTIRLRVPRPDVCRTIMRRAHYALAEERARQLEGLPAERPPVEAAEYPEVAEAMEETRAFVIHTDRAMDLLSAFWAAPAGWLRRLRRCQYPGCQTPYFLDRAAAGHARFCSPKHRVYAARLAHNK